MMLSSNTSAGTQTTVGNMMSCASCGVAEADHKLKICTACNLVRYCSVNCQKEHRPQHKRECKRMAAELRDKILFKQPESSHVGDCPICCLPLPLDRNGSAVMSCCSNIICDGCAYANQMREMEGDLQQKCPFCRQRLPNDDEEADLNTMKRVEANDPVATYEMGIKHYIDGDYASAFNYFKDAVELGDVESHYTMSHMYREGLGVEKDKKKQIYHLEEAAIGGHADARYNLASYEWSNLKFKRALNHWIVAARLGHNESMQTLERCYTSGEVNEEDFISTFRAYQAARDAETSPQRKAAAKADAA